MSYQCSSCESRSYVLHDPMHIFFKLPRPVQRPLESPTPFLPDLLGFTLLQLFGNRLQSLTGTKDQRDHVELEPTIIQLNLKVGPCSKIFTLDADRICLDL